MPKPGDFGVLRTGGIFFPWAIRFFTRSTVNHAVVYIGMFEGVESIIEANPRGVQISPVTKYHPDQIEWSDCDLTDLQRADIVKAALGMRGLPYGFVDIVALGITCVPEPSRWLSKRVKAWAIDVCDRQTALVCSQVVAKAYHKAGLQLGDKNFNLVTPADLKRWLHWDFSATHR